MLSILQMSHWALIQYNHVYDQGGRKDDGIPCLWSCIPSSHITSLVTEPEVSVEESLAASHHNSVAVQDA
jgi:hypothetical protein